MKSTASRDGSFHGEQPLGQAVQQRDAVRQPGERVVQSLVGQGLLGYDLCGHIARDAEGADDPAAFVPEWHFRARHPGERLAAMGFLLQLPDDRFAGADDLLLVFKSGGGMLLVEKLEVRLTDQLGRGMVRGPCGDPACAGQKEPALQVLEVPVPRWRTAGCACTSVRASRSGPLSRRAGGGKFGITPRSTPHSVRFQLLHSPRKATCPLPVCPQPMPVKRATGNRGLTYRCRSEDAAEGVAVEGQGGVRVVVREEGGVSGDVHGSQASCGSVTRASRFLTDLVTVPPGTAVGDSHWPCRRVIAVIPDGLDVE